MLGLLALQVVTAAANRAEGASLLQSLQPELGRAVAREQVEAKVPQDSVPEGRVRVEGFFVNQMLPQDYAVAFLGKDTPDDSSMLQFLCGVLLSLFMCAILALATAEDLRPKSDSPPLPARASGLVQEPPRFPQWPGESEAASLPPVSRPSPLDEAPASSSRARGGPQDAAAESRGAAGRSKSPHLCQGLVVPGGSECVLAVRLPARPSEGQAEIMDLSGQAVLMATLKPTDLQAQRAEPAVILRPTPNAAGSQTLAHCYVSRGGDGEYGIDICKATGELYARLERDPSRPRYVMTKRGMNPVPPTDLLFDGLFKEHAVLVSDGVQPEPTADAEPCNMSFDPQGTYYRLRVSSNMDVGLMICCLFSIDELVRLGV